MMIHTFNHCATTAKTAEILSRYRPIAPKPETPSNPMSETPSELEKIKQSPDMHDACTSSRAPPTRTRKRGRQAILPPSLPGKKPKAQLFPAFNAGVLPLLSFGGGVSDKPTLSLLSFPTYPIRTHKPAKTPEGVKSIIDLNKLVDTPEEKDFLQLLQRPGSVGVIVPQPVRPVGSSIRVGRINEDRNSLTPVKLKKREEVEEEVESEALPAVVSDSSNKVRLANSAYKEMVGQPECTWLESMVTCDRRYLGDACKRICGEVMIRFSGAGSGVPVSSNRFSCWVTIEWGSKGKNSSVHAFSEVIRLACESKDYLFAWRFHTREASESCSND
ncbi:hypothetical protein NMG60_11016537 [Bertholletia excelsa]